MLRKTNPEHILFLDIETVPEEKSYKNLDAVKQKLWEEKTLSQRKEKFTAEEFYRKAGRWAEFGKIICISIGYFKIKDDKRTLRISTFQGGEEKLLRDFAKFLDSHFYKPQHVICAHNGKEFDFPFIARRMVIHNILIPEKLNPFGRKPWEIPHLDTLELWKFGDPKHYTSLNLLTKVLGIPSPEGNLSRFEVRDVYYIDHEPGRIINYCERHVIAIVQIILKLRQEDLLEDEEIIRL